MLASVITPTHNPRYLEETHASLKLQVNVPWEWVIVPNQIAPEAIPFSVRQDPRVKIVPYPVQTGDNVYIGALKNFGFHSARGDLLIELDHDDMLAPNILSDLAEAYDKGGEFIFTDAAVFETDTYRAVKFDSNYGWATRPITVYGWPMVCTQAFPVTARSLCEIHWAPDHVRCWSSKVYKRLGGHNKAMLVADDHDLICRTYLDGAKFSHVDKCGYFYRLFRNKAEGEWHNSYSRYQEHVRKNQVINCEQYLRPLVRAWSDREGLPWADLAEWLQAGWDPLEGYVPVEESSLGYIVATNTLQLMSMRQCIAFFNMAYRALVPGGWLLIDVPDFSDAATKRANDGKAKSGHNISTFRFYVEKTLAETNPLINCRYQQVFARNYSQGRGRGLQLRIDMCALKGQRQPGAVFI